MEIDPKYYFYLIFINLILAAFVSFHIATSTQSYNQKANLYNYSQEVGSTKRDAVFFYATKPGPGLILSISSLRGTGCRCRIILFASSSFEFTTSLIQFFNNKNVEIIFNADEKQKRSFAPHMLRYEYELQWIQQHKHEIDRILHSDSLDVFFQGDPFTSSISNDSLTFIVEPHCIRSCGWNIAWIDECYGRSGVNFHRHNFIICSGSISGNINEYHKLIELMISQDEWKTCWGPSHDQPILNHIVWSGLAKSLGIKYKLSGCDGGFFTMQWCVIDKNVLFNEHNQIISTGGSVPSYIHQYNRYQNLTKKLLEIYVN